MRPEIQEYFRSVAEQYRVVDHVRFHSIVEKAEWSDNDKVWVVSLLDLKTNKKTIRRAKILISGVGSLSVPKKCNLPGTDTFKGKMFHSAQWDHTFSWADKDVVVLGNTFYLPSSSISRTNSPNRKRLLSNPISPHHGFPTLARPPHHPIRPSSAIPL
jgi:hypothetical protein